MTTPHTPEQQEKPFEQFNDLQSYNETLRKTMNRAAEIIAMNKRGLSDAERAALKNELPILVQTLRHLLKTQLDSNGLIARTDKADGSYDNADVDNKLRQQLGALRDLNTDVNRMVGTKTVRKLTGMITEDLPNWFGVKWEQVKDNLKQALKAVAVFGGLTAAGLLGGYSLYAGSLSGGASMLGNHLSKVGGALASGASDGWKGLKWLKTRIFG